MLPSDSKRKRKGIVRASTPPLHTESSKPGNMIPLKNTFVVLK
jgi:hypothetical protein